MLDSFGLSNDSVGSVRWTWITKMECRLHSKSANYRWWRSISGRRATRENFNDYRWHVIQFYSSGFSSPEDDSIVWKFSQKSFSRRLFFKIKIRLKHILMSIQNGNAIFSLRSLSMNFQFEKVDFNASPFPQINDFHLAINNRLNHLNFRRHRPFRCQHVDKLVLRWMSVVAFH